MSKQPRIFLVVAATIALALVAFAQVAPAASARDQALDLFVKDVKAACVGAADVMFDMNEVDKSISTAQPHAGWVVEDLLFIGSLDEAVSSLDGSVSSADGSSYWVRATRDAPKLLRLERRSVGKVDAFMVRETFTVC